MVDVDKAIIARFKTHGKVFEVLVDCDLALKLKAGKDILVQDVLAFQKVFTDARKAQVATDADLAQVFGAPDHLAAAKDIIRNGDIQITAEHRARIIEDKRKRILGIIHMNGVDPKTHLPHPMTRLELAFDEAKIKISEFEPVDRQVKDILKKLLPILPISFERKEIVVKVPPEFGIRAYPIVKSMGELKKDEWLDDGSWSAVVEIPAGMQNDLFDKLNSLTHGNVQSRILDTKKDEVRK